MQEIKLKDKSLFDSYLFNNKYPLSSHCFASIFIWRKLFKISWEIIDDCLCVLASNQCGCFLIVPPQGRLTTGVIKRVFKIMDGFNKNTIFSRIENVTPEALNFYKSLGLEIVAKDSEYLYSLRKLCVLSGSAFKSKRSSLNFFAKHYSHEFEPLAASMADECLGLYRAWSKERRLKFTDPVYRACLQDTLSAQEQAFEHFSQLGLSGWLVRVDGRVAGYSLGTPLNPEVFYIMFETADLKLKGISQFLFRSFCQRLEGFAFVNAGDDSGFENLKLVKQSYRPLQPLSSYIAQRRCA
jgi:hypothetical protein